MKTAIRLMLMVAMFVAAAMAQERAGDTDVCVGGTPKAPVKIEVFSDYQCPACREFYLETMRSVLTDYAEAGKVCVIYREYPLNIHPHAREAARYGEAALRLGLRQWTWVTDALYNKQDEWAQNGKLEPVLSAALSKDDFAKLRKLLADPSIDQAVARDMAKGQNLQVNSTPTFFISARGKTEKVTGVVQYPILKRYLDYLLMGQ